MSLRPNNEYERRLLAEAKRMGFEATRTGRCHLKFRHSDPRVQLAYSPGTPSDYRSLRNSLAMLKRRVREAGLES